MTQEPYRNVGLLLLAVMMVLIGCLRRLLVRQTEEHDDFHGWTLVGDNATHNSSPNRPLRVIYHIGPSKMGSTSIQIGALQKYQQQLRHDGYNVYDFADASKLNECLSRDIDSCQSGQEWNRFLNFIKKSKLQRRSILISTESYWNHLSNDTLLLQAYHDVFASHEYNVRIVIAYRPLFEYWPSVYFQNYNHYCGYSHQDMGTIPSLLDFLKNANESTKHLQHPSYAALEHAQQYWNDTIILSLGNKFVERFLCHAVIRATRACTAVQRDELHATERIQNPGHSLAFNRLAQAARAQQLSNLPCKTLSDYLESQLEQDNGTVLPQSCLDESQQEWFWNQTLYYHDSLVPNSTLSNQDLKLLFQAACTTTLCDVNVEQTLKEYSYLLDGTNTTGG